MAPGELGTICIPQGAVATGGDIYELLGKDVTFPENGYHGADIIELDVAKTKDGRYVLLHDNVIDRVTDGKGACSDYMLEDPAGSFSLEIPAYWYCSDSTAATALPVPNTQTTWLYSNGTMRISKCGVTWERDLDGTERQILEN